MQLGIHVWRVSDDDPEQGPWLQVLRRIRKQQQSCGMQGPNWLQDPHWLQP